MKIVNTSFKDILIKPEKTSLSILDTISLKDKKVFANDPEQKILPIDKQNAINEVEATNTTTFNVIYTVIDLYRRCFCRTVF